MNPILLVTGWRRIFVIVFLLVAAPLALIGLAQTIIRNGLSSRRLSEGGQ